MAKKTESDGEQERMDAEDRELRKALLRKLAESLVHAISDLAEARSKWTSRRDKRDKLKRRLIRLTAWPNAPEDEVAELNARLEEAEEALREAYERKTIAAGKKEQLEEEWDCYVFGTGRRKGQHMPPTVPTDYDDQ